MTPEELEIEFNYRYEERLGILCDSDDPTPEQVAIASSEAWAAIEALQRDSNVLYI